MALPGWQNHCLHSDHQAHCFLFIFRLMKKVVNLPSLDILLGIKPASLGHKSITLISDSVA